MPPANIDRVHCIRGERFIERTGEMSLRNSAPGAPVLEKLAKVILEASTLERLRISCDA